MEIYSVKLRERERERKYLYPNKDLWVLSDLLDGPLNIIYRVWIIQKNIYKCIKSLTKIIWL